MPCWFWLTQGVVAADTCTPFKHVRSQGLGEAVPPQLLHLLPQLVPAAGGFGHLEQLLVCQVRLGQALQSPKLMLRLICNVGAAGGPGNAAAGTQTWPRGQPAPLRLWLCWECVVVDAKSLMDAPSCLSDSACPSSCPRKWSLKAAYSKCRARRCWPGGAAVTEAAHALSRRSAGCGSVEFISRRGEGKPPMRAYCKPEQCKGDITSCTCLPGRTAAALHHTASAAPPAPTVGAACRGNRGISSHRCTFV